MARSRHWRARLPFRLATGAAFDEVEEDGDDDDADCSRTCRRNSLGVMPVSRWKTAVK
jgi:hypothetical protein